MPQSPSQETGLAYRNLVTPRVEDGTCMTQFPTDQTSSLPRVTLILGGARSGKSAYAERLIVEGPGRGVYIATAEARDPEMTQRIAQHRDRRGPTWQTIEAPLDLVGTLSAIPSDTPILIDCLTLWVSNLMEAEADLPRETERLAHCLTEIPGPVILVANEIGLGIVPDNQLARRFRDHAGCLNQAVAASADQVLFIAAGLPMRLK
jgi:adenosylcobinamide kinase/adenosylcobinamide-phosphate guanylyltransferase